VKVVFKPTEGNGPPLPMFTRLITVATTRANQAGYGQAARATWDIPAVAQFGSIPGGGRAAAAKKAPPDLLSFSSLHPDLFTGWVTTQ